MESAVALRTPMTSTRWAEGLIVANAAAWAVLVMYALYNAWLLWCAWRARRSAPVRPPAPDTWPFVTIQLPVYNEPCVAELLQSAAAIDYPRHLLEIQLLDDSDADWPQTLEPVLAQVRHAGITVHHIRRTHRQGFKAGALAQGMRTARGNLFLLLDADFAPAANLLKQLVPWFSNPRVGMVQARWGNLRAARTVIARCAGYWIDRHFSIEQLARSRSGQFFHFNGSAGMWRRGAIEQAGGWQSDTLAEDMDLSFRAWRCGWQFVYDHGTVVPAQVPPDAYALHIQQRRWARGAFQVAKKTLPNWRKQAGVGRFFISLHLTGYCFPMLMLLLALLAGPVAWARGTVPAAWTVLADTPVTVVTVLLGLHVLLQALLGGWHAGRIELEAAAVGMGLAPVLFSGAVAGLRAAGGTFERTPKEPTCARVTWNALGLSQLGLSALCIASAVAAGFHGTWLYCAQPCLAAWGLWLLGSNVIWPTRFAKLRPARHRRRAHHPIEQADFSVCEEAHQ